jgi:MFS family permease
MTERSAPRHAPWLVLAIVSLPVFIGALDLTIISAVLPEVIVSLDLPVKEYLDHASWAVSGYLLTYAISMTFAGRLSDLFGRRVVYITCLLIFIAGSYLVTAYDSPLLNEAIARFYRQVLGEQPPRLEERYLDLVIFGRVVQAFGAGAMVPVTIALIGDLFPPERRARPLGVVGAVDTLGWVLGHLYGGVMVRLFGQHGDAIVDAFARLGLSVAKPSWETLFVLNIPIGVLALVGAWWVLRGVHRPRRTERFDVLGTLFLSLALIGLNLGLGTNPETAGTAESFEELGEAASPHGPLLLVGAALAFLVFLLVESRVRYPLIRLGMFRSRNVSASSITNFLVGFCLAIGLVSAPLLVNFRMDSPTSNEVQRAAYTAGLLLSGLTVPMALAAIPGGWLAERFGYRLPTVLGLLIAATGFVVTGATWESDTSYWLMGAQMTIIGVGLGLTISPVGTAVLNDVTERERGSAAALILILRLVGMTIAISSLTVFALQRFDVLLAEHMANVTTGLEETLLASQAASLKAAVDVISELQFIGAGATLIALGAALLLRGGRATSQDASPA